MKVLVDANIIIYSAQKNREDLRRWLRNHTLFVSSITHLEVLGYHKITKEEIALSKRFFSLCLTIHINQSILDEAIKFRQLKSMSLGDALVAATASKERLPIATANIKDFQHIGKLKLINPLISA